MSITLSPGLRLVAIGRYMHFCPGCKEPHFFTLGIGEDGRKVGFNGNLQRPTFSPDQRIERDGRTVCRYFLTDGELQFMDCAHGLRNQSVPLPVFPMLPLPQQPPHP